MNGLSVKRVDCAENEEGMLKIREWSVELRQWDSGNGRAGNKAGYWVQDTETSELKVGRVKFTRKKLEQLLVLRLLPTSGCPSGKIFVRALVSLNS